MILLTKADLGADAAAVAAALERRLDGTPVRPVSVVDGTGLEEVGALLAPRRTAVLLGSSGVGKSTLAQRRSSARSARARARSARTTTAAATPPPAASSSRSRAARC